MRTLYGPTAPQAVEVYTKVFTISSDGHYKPV